MGGYSQVSTNNVSGITVKNCLHFMQVSTGSVGSGAMGNTAALPSTKHNYAYNNIIFGCGFGITGYASGDWVEDYNNFYSNTTDRGNTSVGAHSTAYPVLLDAPRLLAGFRFPFSLGELSKWSQLLRIAGTSESTDDFWGMTRPVTSSKKSWGPFQATGAVREVTTIHGGATSIKLPDAGQQFLMHVPASAVSTVFNIYCYREANYAGTNPSLIIRQPGVAETKVTDAGSAGAWNLLTATLTPSALPTYVDIFISSENTAAAGSYAAYFDDFSVT